MVVNYSVKHIFQKANTVFWSRLSELLTYSHKLKANLEIFTEQEKDGLAATETSESHFLSPVMTFR